jgi:microcystin-dependent protein
MGTPYVGEIRMFGGNFAPVGWMLCQGQLLPISENETLFNLIGTTYGGDGQSTFGLPNLQSRVPIHQGPGFVLAQLAGEETVTLITQQIPNHNHTPAANSANGTQGSPSNGVWAQSSLNEFSVTNPPNLAMAPQAILASGGSQPHDNMMPYLVINFIISLFGVFPSQT